MTEQDQTPRPDDDTEGHSWRLGKTADRRKDDDDTRGHLGPAADTGDDDDTDGDDDSEGHGYYHGG